MNEINSSLSLVKARNFPVLKKFIENAAVMSSEESPKEVWPEDAKLYQPLEQTQVLLPDIASCLSVQAFLRMCNLNYSVIHKHNTEDMSPSGQVPLLKCSVHLISEFDRIVQFVKQTGVSLTKDLDESQRTEMRAYISLISMVLVSAENYIVWADDETYNMSTKIRFGSVYPWPLNLLLVRQKRQQILRKQNALGWRNRSVEDVCRDVDMCCNALATRLDGIYFFGNKPTELDAVVFAHVYTILTTPLPKTQFAGIVLCYPKLVKHCQRIIDEYFSEYNITQCELEHVETSVN